MFGDRSCPLLSTVRRSAADPARTGVSVPSGRGCLRRSGPPRSGTDRPAGHGKADEGVVRNSRLLVGLVVDLGGRDVALDRLDALDGARLTRLTLVGLAGGDHLAVGGDQVEAELAGRALLEHELGCHMPSLGRVHRWCSVPTRPATTHAVLAVVHGSA